MAPLADVVVLWARDAEDMQVKGFLIEKGTPGYDARAIEGKGSLRALWQADIDLTDVRVPAENRLPGANSFADTAKVLKATRASCAWSALGHAVAGYDAALNYAAQRTQFGKPLARFQIVQEKLVRMLARDHRDAVVLPAHRSSSTTPTAMSDTIAALGKLNNTVKAREVLAEARNLLGGNGILLENHVIRHMTDIEAIYTFEGTETIQTLLVGRDITGLSAFT